MFESTKVFYPSESVIVGSKVFYASGYILLVIFKVYSDLLRCFVL